MNESKSNEIEMQEHAPELIAPYDQPDEIQVTTCKTKQKTKEKIHAD